MYIRNRLQFPHTRGFPLTRVFEDAPIRKGMGRRDTVGGCASASPSSKCCTATPVSSEMGWETASHPLKRMGCGWSMDVEGGR